ncbi:MAG: GntR family transcriptional regulator [Bacillota bacterium]
MDKYTIDEIYNELESDILYLRLQPGEVISENTLCGKYGVSRTPIRSVLQKLQTNGLVNIKSRASTTVSLLNFDEIQQMIYLRTAAETMVLRDFIQSATPLDIEKAKFAQETLVKLYAEYQRTQDIAIIQKFYACDLQTHLIWFEQANKHFLWEKISNSNSSYTRFRILDMKLKENFNDVICDHQMLIDAISNKDVSSLEKIITDHLSGGIKRIGNQIFTTYKDFFII